jgi:hypothetical protein
VCSELRALALGVIEQDRLIVTIGVAVGGRVRTRRRVELVGLARMLGRKSLERRRPVLEPLLDRRRVPFTQGEDARLHADEGIVLLALLDEGCEARTHRDLGALAHVAQQVSLDSNVRYLFVM